MINQHINKIPKTYYGKRSINALKDIPQKKIVIIYSKSLEKNEEFQKIKKQLVEKELTYISPKKNTLSEILNTSEQIKDKELIIAIGGGNIIDFSKLLKLKIDNPDMELLQINSLPLVKQKTQLIAIPSTPSTGSQVTPIAITHDQENNEKIITLHEKLIPDLVILSSKLLITLNKKQMATFICDIFAHSVEAYLSRLTNIFVKDLAQMNLKTLVENWKAYNENSEDLLVLEKIAINGQIGGICQGNAYVGVMHALAHQVEIMSGKGHSQILLHIIKPVLEWYNKNIDNKIYSEFIRLFDKLKIEEYKENIFKDIDKEELAVKTLKDPLIKTSPIVFDEQKIRELIKWI